MATTQNEHNGNGTLRRFSFTFPYIKEDDVRISLRTSVDDVTVIASTEYTFPSATEIQFNALSGAATTFQETTGAPKTGVTIRIFRDTDLTTERVTFFPGSSIRAQDLNDNTLQNLYASQERQDRAVDSTGGTMTGNFNLQNANLVFTGTLVPPGDNNETTVTVVEPTQDNTITLPNRSGTVITSGDTNTVNTTIVDGSLTDANIAAGAEIAVNKLANGTARQVLQTAANGTDVEFTSNVDLPGTLDVTGLSTFSNVNITGNLDVDTTANLDAVDIDDNVDLGANLNFTGAARVISAVDNNATALTITDGADTYLTFNTANGQDKVVTNKTLNVAGNLEISGTQVTSSATNLNIVDGMTKSTTLVTSSDTEFPTSKAVADWVTTQLGAIDGFVAVAAATDVPGASGTAVPLGVTISIADAGDIPVDPNGQAQYTAIGNTNNVSGQVTITGIPTSFRPNSGTQDVVNGVRFLVEGTGNAGSYTYHKATLKEDDLVQLSDDINDFNERYRTDNTGSNPTTNNDSGDLFFNQSTGKMLVFNGLNSAWEEVQSIGQFFEIPASELADFAAGTAATEIITNAPTTAQQILLSINGVIQKPNAGTGTPAEGFTLNGGLITLAATPPAGSAVFGVIIGSSVNIGTPSANTVDTLQLVIDSVDNTILDSTTGAEAVDTNVIRDNAINAAKIQDNQVTEPKLATTSAGTVGFFLRKTGATTMDWADVPSPTTQDIEFFTGDNNTTAFTLANGAGHTVHTCLVVLNGIVLRPTTTDSNNVTTTRDYNIATANNTTTLTFTTAPGTGDEIDVRYLPN